MSQEVNFSVDVGGLGVSGRLHRPTGEVNGKAPPAVLLCRASLEYSEPENDLLAAIEHGLVASGVAVATFDPRIRTGESEDGSPISVPDPVECAVAAFNWLTARIDLDGLRLSALGFGVGAIVASGLALRMDKLSRLCLISPSAPDWLAGQLAPRNGSASMSSLPAMHRHLQPLTAVPAAQALAANNRPTMLILGAADRAQRPDGARVYELSASNASRHAEIVHVPFADAAFSSVTARQLCVERVVSFLTMPSPEPAVR